MPSFGVTPTGFVIRTLENLNTLVISAVQSAIGVLPVDALLVVINIVCERFAELWQLGQAVYITGDVDAAQGAAQDNINSVTGTVREPARASTTTLTWTGNPGVTVINGARAKHVVTLQPFATTADETGTGAIVAAPAYATAHAYLLGDRVTNAGNCYLAIAPGTSVSGPTTTAAAIPDGVNLIWRFIGTGTGTIDLAAAAVFTGPVPALSGSITSIDTSMSGVLGVVNLADAVVGADVESNPDYRVRREQELAKPGSGTSSAIAAAVTPDTVVGVSNVTVFQNSTNMVNVDGMPANSVELLALGGDSTLIAKILLANVDAGIQTTGNTTVILTDDQGFMQTVKFSRPVEKDIYNTLSVTYDAKTFPSDGVAQIKNAIVAYGQAQRSGVDARPYQIGRVTGAVGGVLDITSNTIGLAPSPVGTANIVIAQRELAVYDTSRIVINATPGTP